MVVKSMHLSLLLHRLGKWRTFSVPQFYSSVQGGTDSTFWCRCRIYHTDPPLRLRHVFSQLQECWLLTVHTESLPGTALNQRKLIAQDHACPWASLHPVTGPKTWPPGLDWTMLKGHPASDLAIKSTAATCISLCPASFLCLTGGVPKTTPQ